MESPLCEGGRAPGLRLIETFLWNGEAFQWLDLHLGRMTHGAAALGWEFEAGRVRTALWADRTLWAPGPCRVRVTMGRQGDIAVDAAPVPPAVTAWRIGLAARRLDSADPWLRVKTTHRPAYDAARATLGPGLDEVLFLNERGEVCDGSISTIFFDRGHGLRTPPLSAGLLPGILRARLIAGGVQEEGLSARDLTQVRLWAGNSLRGLIPAVWEGGPGAGLST